MSNKEKDGENWEVRMKGCKKKWKDGDARHWGMKQDKEWKMTRKGKPEGKHKEWKEEEREKWRKIKVQDEQNRKLGRKQDERMTKA